ncbi:MAG TPA: uroporphyrinogen decarboxylase family protein [Victivallales bacterium]|nr:uroporphyrinogen decarboxylase family protein [Victivallales bacterium]
MNCRERVLTTLNHNEPDRVAVDFGSTAVTGLHILCIEQIRKFYGLELLPVKVSDPYQMLGQLEDDLLEVLGVDTVSLPAPTTMFGFRNENWKPFKTQWGQDILVADNFNTTKNKNNDLFIYPDGDLSVSPSGKMPDGGFFFDSIIRQDPIDEAELNFKDNLEEFSLLSEKDIEYYKNYALNIKNSGRAVIAGIGGTAIGDISMVPAPFLKHPKGIRDIEEWYISTIMRQDYLHKIFSKQTEIALLNLAKLNEAAGDIIDVIFICGTDFGTQTSSFCSTETYESLYAPYYKKMNNWIHRNTKWKTFKHSCGAVFNFMPHFIESGFDIINPVQCSASGMDPALLKKEFGKNIVFWGAGVDTQKTLAFETPEQVKKQVLERCEIFSKDGGFVFNAIHNIQANTPIDNIIAIFEALKEFNGNS